MKDPKFNLYVCHSGTVRIAPGADLSRIYVDGGGELIVDSGARLRGVMVDAGGSLTVYEGGYADSVIENGGDVVDCSKPDDSEVYYQKNVVYGASISSDRDMSLHSGTTACGVCVHAGGFLTVYSGGSAIDVRLEDAVDANDIFDDFSSCAAANLQVLDGGYVSGCRIGSGAEFRVSSGGTALGLVLEQGAILSFQQGAKVEYKERQIVPYEPDEKEDDE
jgi:autotransporter passenger strand-loop-strand repeat protein